MELFFEEVMIKKNEQIGLICSYIWYKVAERKRQVQGERSEKKQEFTKVND